VIGPGVALLETSEQWKEKGEVSANPSDIATAFPHDDDRRLSECSRKRQRSIYCKECGEVLKTCIPVGVPKALIELGVTDEICAVCPHCEALNTFAGLSAIYAFVCSACGEGFSIEKHKA
jgi:hypothetical protein